MNRPVKLVIVSLMVLLMWGDVCVRYYDHLADYDDWPLRVVLGVWVFNLIEEVRLRWAVEKLKALKRKEGKDNAEL